VARQFFKHTFRAHTYHAHRHTVVATSRGEGGLAGAFSPLWGGLVSG
jgi:uncharacterized protein YjlB